LTDNDELLEDALADAEGGPEGGEAA